MVNDVAKTVSDGSVTISVETYQDLLARASEKAPVIYNTVQKTQAMAAADNKVWGALLSAGGGIVMLFGSIMYALGRAQEKDLEKQTR